MAVCGPIDVGSLRPWIDERDLSDGHPTGQGSTSVTQLVVGLLELGTKVTVVTLDPHVKEPVRFEGEQLSIRIGPYRASHRARDAFAVERRFIRASLSNASVELVHAHWTYEYALGALGGDNPTLVTVRDWAPAILRYQPTPYRLVRLLMNFVALGRSRALTVPSPYMQKKIRRWTGREAQVIPNALADDSFSPRERRTHSGAPEVLAVNNGFSGYKNVGVLLAAFPRVRADFPDVRLRLVGSSYEPKGLAHRWATERSLADGVIFHGPVAHHQLFRLFRAADIFVHPSLEESFGNVLVEAMSQGLPVIGGSTSGAVPWVLGEGSAGVLADVTSPERLADAICAVIQDDDARWRISEAGFQRAASTFRVSAVIPAYLDEYRHLLLRGDGAI